MAYDDLPLRIIHNHTHLKNQMMQLFLQMPKIHVRCRGVSCDIKSQ